MEYQSTISFEKDIFVSESVRVRAAVQSHDSSPLIVYMSRAHVADGEAAHVSSQMRELSAMIDSLYITTKGLCRILDWGITKEGNRFAVVARPNGVTLASVNVDDRDVLFKWAADLLRILKDLCDHGYIHSSFEAEYDVFVEGSSLCLSFPAVSQVFEGVSSVGIPLEDDMSIALGQSASKALSMFVKVVQSQGEGAWKRDSISKMSELGNRLSNLELSVIEASRILDPDAPLHETMLYTAPDIISRTDGSSEEVNPDLDAYEFNRDNEYSFNDDFASAENTESFLRDLIEGLEDAFGYSKALFFRLFNFRRTPESASPTKDDVKPLISLSNEEDLKAILIRYFVLFTFGICLSIAAFFFLKGDKEESYPISGVISASISDKQEGLGGFKAGNLVNPDAVHVREEPVLQQDPLPETHLELPKEASEQTQVAPPVSGIPSELKELVGRLEVGDFEVKVTTLKKITPYCNEYRSIVSPVLFQMLGDPDNLVRGFAAKSYGQCVGEDSVIELEKRRKVEESQVVLDVLEKVIKKVQLKK